MWDHDVSATKVAGGVEEMTCSRGSRSGVATVVVVVVVPTWLVKVSCHGYESVGAGVSPW